MKHLGDITKINGAEISVVDCIIGGSPCQDLSVAGSRHGLAGERSGLFMEQIRVIKEMGEVYELPDSARYRIQGNGICTPFWKYLIKRISAQYERDPTLGSLFDGQGSFPMLWENVNGKGTALWASEIDKHAVAVCKYHFPEDEIE